MKRYFLSAIILLFLLSTTGFGQQKPFRLGFEVSPDFGWLKPSSKGYKNAGSETGFSWGFVSEFFLLENYDIATGFHIVYLNGRLTYPHRQIDVADTVDGTLERKYGFKYVEFPIVLKMTSREFNKVRFYGKIGMGTSLLLSATAKDKFTGKGASGSAEKEDIKAEIITARASLILGTGIEYSIGGNTSLVFGLEFDNGFTDVLKDQNTIDPDINNSAINNYLKFGFGIIF